MEHYYQLRSYELNPFEEVRIFSEELFISGKSSRQAPYTETCDLNWEFDKAMKKLGEKEELFKHLYLDGFGVDKKLLKQFTQLLRYYH